MDNVLVGMWEMVDDVSLVEHVRIDHVSIMYVAKIVLMVSGVVHVLLVMKGTVNHVNDNLVANITLAIQV